MDKILKYFPNEIFKLLKNTINQNPQAKIEENLQEIRIRINRPIMLKLKNFDILIEYIVTEKEILQILEKLCENSIYAYKNQISEGFITVTGGHRIGITGTAVIEQGKIINIKYISSLNFRIAREIKGASNQLLKEIINQDENNIYNTLIVSPPGKGKTTILRDAIRQISNGIKEINFKGKTCGIVDERGEIAACYRGIPQNDVGIRTDVIENVTKSQGIKMLIRSMSPQIIACDEIGSKEDMQAIKYAFSSGVKGIFTMHGANIEDIKRNPDIDELLKLGIIEKIFII